uniref:Penicillin-binding protein n=1 Tax=Anisakis simplex TaxID=6269 RepID=A0A0M3JPG2_ANISI
LYQESRRIVAAQLQHITFSEFLPVLLGREIWHRYGLNPTDGELGMGRAEGENKDKTRRSGYSLDMNPTVINSYAAVVGQFFYTMYGSRMARINENGVKLLEKPLNDYFNNPSSLLYYNQGIEEVL